MVHNQYLSLNDLMSERKEGVVAKHQDSDICWQQFSTDVFELSQRLIERDEHKWALCFQDSYYCAVAFMALAHAGKHLILPSNYQPAALEELSSLFDATLHDGLLDNLFNKPAYKLPLEHCITGNQRRNKAFSSLILQDIQLTLFTSGTSDTPKPIEKNVQHLSCEVDQLEALWGPLLGNTIICSTVSHQHIYGLLFRVLWPLCSGRAFERLNLVYPEQVLINAQDNRTLISSPALLKRVDSAEGTGQYRALFSSGGPLPEEAAKSSLQRLGVLPIEVFGSTETGGIAYRQQQAECNLWTLFPCVSARLNSDGCLTIKSPFIFEQQWYDTSDYCQLMANNQFVLKGRADRVIKIEEKRLSLTEVEKRLSQLQFVGESAVVPIIVENRTILCAVITLTPYGDDRIALIGKGKFWIELRKYLREWLEPVGIPRKFRVVNEIPTNSQGKRIQRDLVSLFES